MANHVIKRQVLDIQVDSVQQSGPMQNRIRDLFYERILPRMEEIFDQECPPGVVIRLDSLELDLGDLPPERLDAFWEDEVEVRLIEQVREALQRGERKMAFPQGTVTLELLRTFLLTGNLPWWQRGVESPDQLLRLALEEAPNELTAWLLSGNLPASVAERLTTQFSRESWMALMEQLTGAETVPMKKLYEGLSVAFDEPLTVRNVLSKLMINHPGWAPGLGALAKEAVQRLYDLTGRIPNLKRHLPELEEALGEDWQRELLQGEEEIPEQKEETEEAPPTELFIENAGLVLLWPFVEEMFENLNLLLGDGFAGREQRSRAIRLLQYLVTGQEGHPEYHLALPKLMCGHPLDAPLFPTHPLNAEEKEECAIVLQAAIEHWEALKNTSEASFQQTFLQRQGRLMETPYDWNLHVHREAFDLLLDKIPWSIGEIALPWMNENIYVEW